MEEEKSKGAEEEHGQSGASANVLLEKGMEKKEEVKEDGEKPAWIRQLEEFVAGLWLWQEEEEEANAGSTVGTEGWSNISQVMQLFLPCVQLMRNTSWQVSHPHPRRLCGRASSDLLFTIEHPMM